MAVLPMKKVLICGLKRNRKRTLEYLQRQGAVEIAAAVEEDQIFKRMNVLSSKAVFERNAAEAEQALGILQTYSPEKKGILAAFQGREPLPLDTYEALAGRHNEIMKTAGRILALVKDVGEKKGSLPRLEQQLQELEPWRTFDLPLDFKGTRHTSAFIGSVPRPVSLEELVGDLTERCGKAVDISIVSSSKERPAFSPSAERRTRARWSRP